MSTLPAALLPSELDDAIRRELAEGERPVWSGQPLPGAFARSAIPLALFGVPFFGFAVFWTVMAAYGAWWGSGSPSGSSPPWFGALFPLFGIPFLVIGAGMLLSPVLARRAARRTVYVLTDRRAIVLEWKPFRGRAVRSYTPERLTKMSRIERRDGSGNLVFESDPDRAAQGYPRWTPGHGFIGVSNVAEVERLVRAILRLDERRAS
jgi:hypothetical protein